MADSISSLRNPAVLAAVRLHRSNGRAESRQAVLEGPMLVGAAVGHGFAIDRVFGLDDDHRGRSLAAAAGVAFTPVTPGVLAKISTTKQPQSPVAVIPIPDDGVPGGGSVIVAWGLRDPGNCGTLIRAAAAFSHGFLAGPGTADLWSPKVLRAASGAHFRTPLGSVMDIEMVRAGGRLVVATVASGGGPPGPLPEPVAIMVGSEPHGLPPEIVDMADLRVTIPMSPGTESLNAAVAGAIVAYVGAIGTGLFK
jgi:TrmH family RNA methyltransferase